MALMQVEFIKDQYIHMPQMGMYWQIHGLKRIGGEDFNGYWNRAKKVNSDMGKLPHAAGNQYHPCLFLLPSQIYELPQDVRVPLSAITYMMVADPSFNGDTMPGHAEWKPVDFVWKSNKNVLMNQYRGTNEHAAEWMSHRFEVVQEAEVKALTDYPSDAYNPWASSGGDTNNGGNNTNDGGSGGVSGGLTMHMVCPHCGKKIF